MGCCGGTPGTCSWWAARVSSPIPTAQTRSSCAWSEGSRFFRSRGRPCLREERAGVQLPSARTAGVITSTDLPPQGPARKLPISSALPGIARALVSRDLGGIYKYSAAP